MTAKHNHDPDKLSDYRAKRSVERTPEPFGAGEGGRRHMFVVQQHAARRVHYDLRLEMNGVLVSWAVPKGPSPNPADKRLAVHTEDHPVEYGDFEGIIPEGNYGAGAVIVWDQGTWVAVEDAEEGMKTGKLLFELRGYKLHGLWTLVKTKQDWLLIKERDGCASEEGTESLPADSIYSGLTVEELRDGHDPAQAICGELDQLNATRGRLEGSDLAVMLAEARKEPFTDSNWIFELKYDGYRLLARRQEGQTQFLSRAGNDLTATFPDIAHAIDALPHTDFVLDGEVVVHDDRGIPNFQMLQKRGRLSRSLDIQRAAVELPATLYVFDLLAFGPYDLRALPIEKRKSLLQKVLPSVGPLRFSDHIAEHGAAMFEQVSRMGLEGIVAKKLGSAYLSGRSPNWLKVRADRTDDFVIVGFTDRKGTAAGFGALHLAHYDGDELLYVGRVGTGFDDSQLDEIRSRLDELQRAGAPCAGDVPAGAEHHWVDPELVCEVRFREITEQHLLRQAAFLHMRDDKPPTECHWAEQVEVLEDPLPVEHSSAERTVPFTNPDKVFWPEEGYTKGDLIEYYRAVSDWILPYLRDRAVVMTRFPDGIQGKSFFQKDAPKFAPDWIRRIRLWSEGSERELDYFVAEDVESLLYIINLGTIPLHIWSSRVATLERPDWCILDLDPKDAPFSDVVTIAQAVHRLCDAIDLPSFVKTSGSTGLHVLIPLGRQCTYEQSRTLGQLLARVVAEELPDVATITRNPAKRSGEVYIDYVQNGHGRLLVSPFCVRPLRGAPVSAPLDWTEVNDSLDLLDYTIETVPSRMLELGDDPFVQVLELKPDLQHALELLAQRVE